MEHGDEWDKPTIIVLIIIVGFVALLSVGVNVGSDENNQHREVFGVEANIEINKEKANATTTGPFPSYWELDCKTVYDSTNRPAAGKAHGHFVLLVDGRSITGIEVCKMVREVMQ